MKQKDLRCKMCMSEDWFDCNCHNSDEESIMIIKNRNKRLKKKKHQKESNKKVINLFNNRFKENKHEKMASDMDENSNTEYA